MMKRHIRTAILVLAVTGIAVAGGTAGSVDTGFGTNGVLVISGAGANSDSVVFDVEAQPDGKILAAGYAASGVVIDGRETIVWRVQRLLADGQADALFGTSGVATFFGDPGNGGESVRALHVDPSGQIWAGGRAAVVTGTTGRGKKERTTYAAGAVVLRLTSNGVLDASFGDQGEVRLFSDMGSVQGLVPLTGGDVLVLGRGLVTTSSSGGGGNGKGKKGGSGNSSSMGIVIARLDSSGTLDSAYGDNGFARLDLDPASDSDYPTLHGAALQSDGSLVVMTTLSGDTSGPRVGLVRFDASGARDASFGDPAPQVYLRSLAVDAQDRILVTGYYFGDVVIQRYDTDGTAPDASFGTSGEVWLDTSPAAFQTEPLGGNALHVDGTRLIVACMEWVDENAPIDGFHSFAVRLLEDGTLDPNFVGALDGFSARLLAMPSFDAVRMPGGDVVFGGQSYASAPLGDWAIGRICGD